MPSDSSNAIPCTLSPWLSVSDGEQAMAFYKAAFGAVEVYRANIPEGAGVVARLSIDGAEFWLSGEPADQAKSHAPPLGGDSVRLILIVANPDAAFAKALAAGAKEVCSVKDDHGWRVGRLSDPFGLHWELARKLGA